MSQRTIFAALFLSIHILRITWLVLRILYDFFAQKNLMVNLMGNLSLHFTSNTCPNNLLFEKCALPAEQFISLSSRYNFMDDSRKNTAHNKRKKKQLD